MNLSGARLLVIGASSATALHLLELAAVQRVVNIGPKRACFPPLLATKGSYFLPLTGTFLARYQTFSAP
jgi:hypothetical protein